METIRFPRHQQPQQQEDEEEDKPMPQADGGNFEEEDHQPPQQNQPPQQDQQPQQYGFPNFQPRYESQYHEDLQGIEETLSSMQFHAQIWQEQEKLAKEVRRGQVAQVAANNKRIETERNMQIALERQGRDIVEIRKQVNLWTNNVSSKEAYACWAQQQANPNLKKGRPLFHGFLKSDYEAFSSSQVDLEESVPLQTAPPSPHFCPPYPPSN
ncbi:hypothetical protein PIB30_097070 [Stylosanthes scabra]|uniref:Clathrin light chain n=1 Tax=Stylosanthes scabra TaxID=79078 RepID=A0ABU6VXU4_9FABA|nr:hypothetical protein [Stylosanthes scabra]